MTDQKLRKISGLGTTAV